MLIVFPAQVKATAPSNKAFEISISVIFILLKIDDKSVPVLEDL